MAGNIFQGSLFTTDFLTETITRGADWQRRTDPEIDGLAGELREIFARFPVGGLLDAGRLIRCQTVARLLQMG